MVIAEGHNGTISCRSVGAPVPSITWEFNNQNTGFEQTDTMTPFQASITGTAGNRVVNLTPGNTVSTLHIVSARYPDHDGVYTCIGTNADDLTIKSSIAFIFVRVHGELHEVYIKHLIYYCLLQEKTNNFCVLTAATAEIFLPSDLVNLSIPEGDQTTLTCTARGVPAPQFMWYRGSELINGSDTRLQVNSSDPILNATTDIYYSTSELTLTVVNKNDSGVFRCEATNILLGVSSNDFQSYYITVNCELFRLICHKTHTAPNIF